MKLEIFGVKLPEIKKGDNIGELVCENFDLKDGDVVVVTSKIVSKAEGRFVKISEIKPTKDAINLAKKAGKPPELVELILRNSRVVGIIPVHDLVSRGLFDPQGLSKNPELALKVLEKDKSLLITLVNSSIYTDAGIDASNVPEGYFALPPKDPMRSAEAIRESILNHSGKRVAVLISDTEVFLNGSIEVCRGYSGICPVKREFGEPDIYGKPKWGGCEALIHEICCAASLIIGQSHEGIPVVVLRGLKYEDDCKIKSISLENIFRAFIKENIKFIGAGKIMRFVFDFLK